MHLRVWPSTVAVTVVVPLDTAVTVPSPEMVATEESEMLQVGLELVPLTLSCHLAPASLSVKSVRLRYRVVEVLPLELVEPPELLAPLVTEL